MVRIKDKKDLESDSEEEVEEIEEEEDDLGLSGKEFRETTQAHFKEWLKEIMDTECAPGEALGVYKIEVFGTGDDRYYAEVSVSDIDTIG